MKGILPMRIFLTLALITFISLTNINTSNAQSFNERFFFGNYFKKDVVKKKTYKKKAYYKKHKRYVKKKRSYRYAYARGVSNNVGTYNGRGVVIGGRPAGCPARYCGCASARYVGLRGAKWNLAYNWVRYLPRTSPAPGMAAARRGHVFILLSHAGGNKWLAYDPNSGGGLTRRHVRSIAGFTVVNPNGSRYAALNNGNNHTYFW